MCGGVFSLSPKSLIGLHLASKWALEVSFCPFLTSTSKITQKHIPIKEARRASRGIAMLQRKPDRTHGIRTSVAYEGKACGMAIAIQCLAGNDLEVSFRSLVSISDLSSIEADYQFFAGLVRRGRSEGFR